MRCLPIACAAAVTVGVSGVQQAFADLTDSLESKC